LGRKGKWEYFRAIYGRYHKADRRTKQLMLNEFCLTTRYHRKYAIRILNGPPPGKRRARQNGGGAELWARTAVHPDQRMGGGRVPLVGAVESAATGLDAVDPQAFQVKPSDREQLLAISPRQMDRRLAAKKNQKRRRIYGRTKPGYLLKHHIPVKTDSWDVQSPGFTEVDLVSHSGNSGEGEFGYSLNITDIQTTWTETRALLGKGQTAVQQALDEIAGMLPFRLLAWTRTTDRNSSTGICRLGANGNRSNSREDVLTRRTTTRISSKRTGLMYESYWAGTL